MTQKVTKAQVVEFWYGILDKGLRQGMWDAIILQVGQPTLANVFMLKQKIELNIVEKKMMMAVLTRTINTPNRFKYSFNNKVDNQTKLFHKIQGFSKGNQTSCWCNFWDNNNQMQIVGCVEGIT